MKIEDIEKIFKSIDTDNSGNIEYTEFISASIEKNIYLKEAFKLFDADGSGKISRAKIVKVLHMDKHSKEIDANKKNYLILILILLWLSMILIKMEKLTFKNSLQWWKKFNQIWR